MSASDWTFVTVTFNSGDALRKYWQRSVDGPRWVVVDNGSSDDSVQVAAELGARVHRLGRNVGFARANNVGLQECRTPFVAFVNPDVSVDITSLSMLEEAIDKTGGLVGPRLLNPDGSPQANQRGAPFLVDKFAHRGVRLPGSSLADYVPDIAGKDVVYVAWLMGAAVAARTEMIRSLGGWNRRYFLYYEDHEIGLRAWRSGSSVALVPAAEWVHGWARDTIRLNWTPWRREMASAAKFYSSFPELLVPIRSLARRRHARLFAHGGSVAY